uniref:Uncharacterized protein n=1 Tax=Nelumbo nucifera TaxID=4432 RepID=A0A822ZTY3_NELNU|nr:TPA_asm: hypothetical protein HUJ06_016918 [Nelumbo nucifera]
MELSESDVALITGLSLRGITVDLSSGMAIKALFLSFFKLPENRASNIELDAVLRRLKTIVRLEGQEYIQEVVKVVFLFIFGSVLFHTKQFPIEEPVGPSNDEERHGATDDPAEFGEHRGKKGFCKSCVESLEYQILQKKAKEYASMKQNAVLRTEVNRLHAMLTYNGIDPDGVPLSERVLALASCY